MNGAQTQIRKVLLYICSVSNIYLSFIKEYVCFPFCLVLTNGPSDRKVTDEGLRK